MVYLAYTLRPGQDAALDTFVMRMLLLMDLPWNPHMDCFHRQSLFGVSTISLEVQKVNHHNTNKFFFFLVFHVYGNL